MITCVNAIIDGTAVTELVPESGGFRVVTSRGALKAKQVFVATNGYTGAVTPWLRRRVIPVGSYIIATAPLDPALLKRLVLPN